MTTGKMRLSYDATVGHRCKWLLAVPGQKGGWWFKEWELARRMMVALIDKKANQLSHAEGNWVRDSWLREKGLL